MNGKRLTFTLLSAVFVLAAVSAWTSGSSSAVSSSVRGKYLAGKGIIIPPEEVYIDTFVATMGYSYPLPTEGVGINLFAGHRQISNRGQEEIIQIGIQGGKREFENLPPLNLAFVIDKSGSMNSEDKMAWVKEAFDIFIERVRDQDFVALITFDDKAKIVFSTTQMNSRDKRLKFRAAVHGIQSDGGTNLVDGLKLGYQQVLANYRQDYTNRVLFLTDGRGKSTGILEMADAYKEMGINVSTIGVGEDFDLELMDKLARTGGGSSRFISDREEMEEIFGSELDRMVVPVATQLEMQLEFLQDVEILETWGYNHRIEGLSIAYSHPTLHHGDYETMLVRVRIPQSDLLGPVPFARFSVSYMDLEEIPRTQDSEILSMEFVEMETPVVGFSNATVLKSGTMMHFAQHLKTIGELYYSCQEQIEEINRRRDSMWRQKEGEVSYDDLTSPVILELEEDVSAKMNRALELAVATKKEVENARMRLDEAGFDDEIEILKNYVNILGKELKYESTKLAEYVTDAEIEPITQNRSLPDHISNLFREMTLDLSRKRTGVVAVSGFTTRSGSEPQLIALLNETAIVEFSRIDTLTLVERNKLHDVLAEQELGLTDLMDTSKAIEVGRFLAADYIVTGSVIEMSDTVVIFGRIIDVETAEIASVAQIILPKDANITKLLV